MTWRGLAKSRVDVAPLEYRLAEQVRVAVRVDQRRVGLEAPPRDP